MRVLGIDIGRHGLGLGFFGDCEPTAMYLPNRHGKGPAAIEALAEETRTLVGSFDWLVIERMQIDSRTGTAEAQQLLHLQWIGGELKSKLAPPACVLPTAGEWSGGVKKEVRINRLIKYLKSQGYADPRAECLIMPPRYSTKGGRTGDAWDGLSLAKWQHDRLSGRTVSRALSPESI